MKTGSAAAEPLCIARIAILGGTFDPIHEGHLALASHFATLLALDELVFMPAGQPWQKSGVSPAADRLAMTRIAAALLNLPSTRVSVSTDEIERKGASYTIATLETWRQRLGPDASLSLLIGADQLITLDSWHRWRELFDFAHICVAARPGFDARQSSAAVQAEIRQRAADARTVQTTPHGGILLDTSMAVDTSATKIRHLAQHSEALTRNIREYVPEPVWAYICEHRLY